MASDELEMIMAHAGISFPQRQKIRNGLIRAAQGDEDESVTAHLPRGSAVSKSLLGAGFDSGACDSICAALVKGGHAADDCGVAKMQANASGLSPLQRQGLALAERFGVEVRANRISKIQMESALEKRSIDERMWAKTVWAQCGFID
jgi:hypothetical protein